MDCGNMFRIQVFVLFWYSCLFVEVERISPFILVKTSKRL